MRDEQDLPTCHFGDVSDLGQCYTVHFRTKLGNLFEALGIQRGSRKKVNCFYAVPNFIADHRCPLHVIQAFLVAWWAVIGTHLTLASTRTLFNVSR